MSAKLTKNQATYRFRGYFNAYGPPNSSCWLRVYELGPGSYLAVASDWHNAGTSVTNAAAALASQVWHELGRPAGFTFIEHYPPTRSHPETWSAVSFERGPDGFLDPPAWRPVRRNLLETLLGQRLASEPG